MREVQAPGEPRRMSPEEVAALPIGATENPDGTISLPLRRAITVSGNRLDAITFRRLTGVDAGRILAAPNLARMALARSLGISLGILAVLDVEMDERELIARADIVGALLGTSHGLPARAEMRGDQSCILPLRFVTTDGFGGIYRSLHLHPLRQTEIRAVPKAHDRRFAIMLRYAVRQSAFETGATSYLPMQSARGLADAMDAVDYFAANAAILHITALAVRKKGSR